MAAYATTSCTAGTNTWMYWCDSTTSTCSTASTTWAEWNGGVYTSATTSISAANVIWTIWADGAQPTARYTYSPPQPTQAKLDAEKKRADEAEKKLAEERKKREAAEKRAEELLLASLDNTQRASFKKEKKFVVKGGDGAAFEIAYGRQGNIREFDAKGKPIARFCIHPREEVPDPDTMLAQKLMLETDPATFRKIANRTPILV